jgi:hypothetical protein
VPRALGRAERLASIGRLAAHGLSGLLRQSLCALRCGHFFDAAYGIWPVFAVALPVQLYDEVRQRQLPRFLVVIVEFAKLLWPSSKAICTCACDSLNFRRASIQSCKWAGTDNFFFAIDCPLGVHP